MAEDGDQAKTSTFNIQMGFKSAPGRGARPTSGRPASARPAAERETMQRGSHLFNRAKSGMVSYEDLLVAQYLDDLRRQKSEVRTEKELPPSPYLQRLPHANLMYGKMARRPHSRRRPFSASSSLTSGRSTKPKIDAKFIADENLWDPATPRDTQQLQRFSRPASAPIRKMRPASGVSTGSVRHRRFRPGSVKSMFKIQPRTINVCAYKNGTRDVFVHASSPSLKILLEFVTEKLGLGFAARRIFLEDGVEIFDGCDIPPHADVYISTGEGYKDPFGPTKKNLVVRQGAKWNLKGIVLPEERKKRKHRLSKRLRNLATVTNMRIVIYLNGRNSEPHEVVVEPHKFDEFLQACTARLELRRFAKRAFDWEGNEIKDLEETPILDDCMQEKSGQVRGPLWISTGEQFSPMGTKGFLGSIKDVLKQKLKNVDFYKGEVGAALDGNMDNVTLPSVKGMNPDELYFAQEEAETEISRLQEAIKDLNRKLKNLKEEAMKEEEMGASYRMTHIKEVEADDRLVGRRGLRLKVYENGLNEGEFVHYFNLREAARGVGDKEKLLQRLLDELSQTTKAASGPQPRLAAVAQRLYNKFGKEITDVMTLEYDQEVWVSWGEAFISPFTYCLEVFYDKAVKATSTAEGTEHILRDPMVDPEVMALTKDNTKFEASIGFPVMYDGDGGMESQIRDAECDMQREHMELDRRATFLMLKENGAVVMYPEVALNEKPRRGHSEAQLWVISKSGYIYNRGMPQLCLAVSDTRVEGQLFGRQTPVEGFLISLQKRMTGNPNQVWRFGKNGAISAESYPQLALTYLGNKFGDDESYNENKPKGVLSGARAYLIVADPLTKKDAAYQRFAVKQERFDNLGQWKHTDVANQEWNKQALSWPVTQEGELNEKYDWPMEGFLQAFAPPLQKSKKDSQFTVLPKRLLVMKNGDCNTDEATSVVGPNLTTMMKENRDKKADKKHEKGKKNRNQDNGTDGEMEDPNIHCMDYSVQELEFNMFLDSCTMLLHLPSAARRIFTGTGEECFSLQALKRDQLVFVSCGEGWSDPRLSREEQQRRVLLSQLATDVGKIKQFCSQRDPQDFVLEVEGSVGVGSRLCVSTVWSSDRPQEASPPPPEPESCRQSSNFPEGEDDPDLGNMTAHERAHVLSEQRQNALKWPWERVVNAASSLDASDMEAHKYSDPQLYQKFKPKAAPALPRDGNQRFVYEDGFILSAANRSVVLGAMFHEGRGSEVLMVKKAPDDVTQRWLILPNGEIRSRYNQKHVLTVSFPTDLEGRGESRPPSLAGCAVSLQTRRMNTFGHAHQRWSYDAETGHITAFNTDHPDKEITAANMSDVCTFAIAGPVEIDQPGYKAEVVRKKGGSTKTFLVCLSCARAMRGRYKLEALAAHTPFACAMGEAKKHRLPQMGSFRVLNGKVDLSTHEALITLQHWEGQLDNLRQETALHIHNQINAAKQVTTVKVMAYKNGEGRMRTGEIICGSTVEGVLSQCTARLGLSTGARRLYAEDGSLLLDVEDVVEYAIAQYRNALADKLEAMLDKEHAHQLPDRDNRDEEARLEELQQSAGQQVNDMMTQALAKVQLFTEDTDAESQRGRGDLSERASEGEGEGDGRATASPRMLEDGKGDTMEANKIARRREELLSRVELPPLDAILRYPIEVWVSSGKSFVAPEVVESKDENRRKKRAVQAKVCLELDVEKHCLRQMKGRRFKDQSPGRYSRSLSTKQPVVREGHWQEATAEEHSKHQSLNKLQSHLGEIQAHQKRDKSHVVGINLSGPLYKQPIMRRVLVYPNGDSPEHALMVWGESLSELLDNSTLKLGLWKKARCFYTEEGKPIETLDAVKPEQLLCVSTGKPFVKPHCLNTAVEVRANWGRARKQYGPEATDIGVKVQKNPRVDVDPFGPPELALPLTDGKELKGVTTA